jgi:hypothetical protein
MPLLIKAHLTDGTVLRCDRHCHDSLNQHRQCICFNRFTGVSYEQALEDLPLTCGNIARDLVHYLPHLRSLEFHFQTCKSQDKLVASLESTQLVISDPTPSTPANATERSGSSSHHH